ncbi:tyrosine-type recombinase/integrase [Mycobacteroides abscessus]|uniref:tyrosine-type recombinase/integrase n=1 Tax=Mycobacteroides abscessus TaxID=36809 RepID=UPI0009D1AB64|nr:site-specific integrase [Mycobacteroides abscessus]SLF31378.1 phage integrase family protein [Mycobacteroides abscessus subsp. abscessus]
MTRGAGRKTRTSGTFGSVDKRATGYRARYTGPDGRRHQAPTLFLAQKDARAWLALRHAEIVRGQWMPPGADEKPAPRQTLNEYAGQWLAARQVSGRPLKDRTREHYRELLDRHILPRLGGLPLASITGDDIRDWHAKTLSDKPTMRAHAYGLLRTIMATAAGDGRIVSNPCVIRGAGTAKRAKRIRPASLAEIETITREMPDQYRAMVLLAAWCALRFGELTELRRSDIVLVREGDDLVEGIVRIERAVVRAGGGFQVTTPKSDAGVRDVAVPPHLLAAIDTHLTKFVAEEPDSLLFPARQGGHMAPATLYRQFYRAREVAGRKDLRWHDLRHSGAVLAAATGATLAELMQRLGHSTPAAAMRYQHAAQGADRRIAAALSALVDTTT